MEALYMIVGSKEVVEYFISHIPLVYGVDRVGVPSSNPCSLKLKVGDKCIKLIRHRKLLRNLIPGSRKRLEQEQRLRHRLS